MTARHRSKRWLIACLLGLLTAVFGVVGVGLYYASLPDAVVGVPPGADPMDRITAGVSRDMAAVGAVLAGQSPEPQVVHAPEPDKTFGTSAPETYVWSQDREESLAAARSELEGTPNRVVIASEGIEVPMTEAAAHDGRLVLPDSPEVAWYTGSAPLGGQGTSVIAGHVNYPDLTLSPFSGIAGVEKGAPVLVTDSAGALHGYRVETLQVYSQSELPEELFNSSGPHQIALITCSGPSISTQGAWAYEYNLVVTAAPV